MTTSRDPRRPGKAAKAPPAGDPAKGYRTPFSRRIKYFIQDTGYALKRGVRRLTDPLRDTGSKRPASAREARSGRPSRRLGRPRSERRDAGRPSVTGARELGERPEKTAGRDATSRVTSRAAPADKGARRRVKSRSSAKGRGRRRRQISARIRRRGPKRISLAGVAAAITRFGERASRTIRSALAPLALPLVGLVALIRRLLARLAALVTPLRATIAVTAFAAILLAVSQFVDYRGVAVGISDYAAYSDVEIVASAPQVDRQPAGSAHAYLLVPVALGALAALVACLRGRWQLGRVVSLLGLLAIAVSLIVDVPAGLDEGAQAVAYAGVEAQLLEGFYAQLVSAAVLVVGGLLVSHYARRSGSRSSRPKRRAATVGPARARTV